MKNFSVARRYARALYELAQSERSVQDVLQALSNLTSSMHASPELSRMFLNPLIPPEEKENLTSKISSNKLVLKFVLLVSRRKRMDLLPLVYEEFQRMADAEAGTNRVLVKTPNQLSDAQKKMIEADLAKRFGGTIVGKFEVARDLIGGVWLQLGDKVLDATVRGRIDDMRHMLTHSIN